MGFFDFIFGKKSEKKASMKETTVTSKPQFMVSETTNKDIEPFIFDSNQHNRYENGRPINGQRCPRTIKVEKNIDGCNGYQLRKGDGYIVRIINEDTGQAQMSAKPMRVVNSSSSEILLKGYLVSAQTPFGYQDIDMSDYGLTIRLENNKVVKCILHMYDRKVDIEYNKIIINQKPESTNRTSPREVTTELELYVSQALKVLAAGRDGDDVYHPLYKAWRSLQNSPEQLDNIANEGELGRAMMIFLSYGTVTDIDDKQQIASIAYLYLSLAIQKTPNDVNLVLTRLLVMLNNQEAFQYTVSSVVNKNNDMPFMNMGSFKARDALLKMEYADLSRDSRLLSIDIFSQAYHNLKNKIQSDFFGENKSENAIIVEGKELHKKVTDYLVNKVINDKDIDF